VGDLDAEALASDLKRASSSLGVEAFLDEIVSPLLQEVGNEWQNNEAGIAREHLASAVLRSQLEELRRAFPPGAGAPRLLVTTPVSESHEFGAMMAAVAAAHDGWRVYYLGPNLPAVEIAAAAVRIGATAVALSIVHPADLPAVSRDLRQLAKALEGRPLLIGGGALAHFEMDIKSIGAIGLSNLEELRTHLRRFRSGSPLRN
jgi:methanogenic corrinoid protein MtbC1